MSPTAKYEVIKRIVARYRTAIKKYKTKILDEFCEIWHSYFPRFFSRFFSPRIAGATSFFATPVF